MGRSISPAPGTFKGLQRGSISLSSSTSATATITAVDTSKAKLKNLGWSIDSTGDARDCARVTLTNSTTITANRGNAGVTAATVVSWEVEEVY